MFKLSVFWYKSDSRSGWIQEVGWGDYVAPYNYLPTYLLILEPFSYDAT